MLGRLACLLPDCECTENPNSITLSKTRCVRLTAHGEAYNTAVYALQIKLTKQD